MRFRLLIFALLVSPAFAQYGVGNFGTQTRTTGPYANGNCGLDQGGIQTITPNTPTSGQATVLLGTSVTCTTTPMSIGFTNTTWDGTGYPIVSSSGTNPLTIVFTSSNSLSYNSLTFPNGYYAAQPNLVADGSGNLWNFFRSCASAEATASGCVADRKSTNGGATWSPNQANIFMDPGTTCDGGTVACDYRCCEVAFNSGNLIVAYPIHDGTLGTFSNIKTGICNPSSVDCTVSTNWTSQTITLLPTGESAGFVFCHAYGTMVYLPGGAVGFISAGSTSTSCTNPHVYMLISCDAGNTWGTGTGCVGLMSSYASTPYRRITEASGGYVVDPLSQEMAVVYIGGTTLYGLSRNNQWSSGCSSPCGQFIQWVSTDLGATWTNALTNIGAYPPPDGSSANTYTEVSPIIFNPNLGGLWMIVWGDRGQSTAPLNYTQNLVVLVNPTNMLSNPTAYPSVPTQFSYTPTLVLGGYPAVAFTGTGNQLLLQWDGSSPRTSQALAVWQETANPSLINTLTIRDKSAKGVSMR